MSCESMSPFRLAAMSAHKVGLRTCSGITGGLCCSCWVAGGRQETEEDDQGFIELEEEDAAEAGADVTRPAPGGAAAPGGPRPQSLAVSAHLLA